MLSIDPKNINPLSLPSVGFDKKKDLPEISGIYFAIDSQGKVQYVGRSRNIKKRWSNRTKTKSLKGKNRCSIAWLEISDPNLLPELESILISWLSPPLNGVNYSSRTIKPGIDILSRIPAPYLPQKLKQARIEDGRSVQVLATHAGISTAYWYQIENNKRDWVSEEIIRKMEKVLEVKLINFAQA